MNVSLASLLFLLSVLRNENAFQSHCNVVLDRDVTLLEVTFGTGFWASMFLGPFVLCYRRWTKVMCSPLFVCFWGFFPYIVQAHGRASANALNGSGINRTKGTFKRGGINSRVESQYRGGLGQAMGWTRWIQKETLRRENWKFWRRDWVGWSLTRIEKDHGFGLEMIWDGGEQLAVLKTWREEWDWRECGSWFHRWGKRGTNEEVSSDLGFR